MSHVIPPTPPQPVRAGRSRVAPAVGVGLIAALVAVASGGVGAGVHEAATVTVPAERIIPEHPDGLVLFPISPVPRCVVADNFGGESKAGRPDGHEGVDIGADEGQAVYAVENGVLERRLDDLSAAPGLGWVLLGRSDTEYRYYHLADFADGLEVGDFVMRGRVIGYVGATGNASPGGWHLHFELRPGPQPDRGAAAPVDPVPRLDIPDGCVVY